MGIVILITIVGLVIAAALGYSIWSDKKRREGFQQLAAQLGIEYRQELAQGDREVFAKFALASLGCAGRVGMTVSGSNAPITILRQLPQFCDF